MKRIVLAAALTLTQRRALAAAGIVFVEGGGDPKRSLDRNPRAARTARWIRVSDEHEKAARKVVAS